MTKQMNDKTTNTNWEMEFPAAITVCDQNGTILFMNQASARTFANQGGMDLVGSNALECHPEPSRSKLKTMLETGKANIYSIETHGKKKLIYQSPWYQDGQYAGFVELSMEIPEVMAHFDRG